MTASDDCYEPYEEGYEPSSEDLAELLEREREFEFLRLEHGDIDQELRNYSKHTDRQLRDLSKQAKSLSRELWNEYQFDVREDCFELLWEDGSILVGRDGHRRDEVPRPVTRKDKRRAKTHWGRVLRRLDRILTKRGCSPRQAKGYEDKSFTTVVAAA